MTHVESSRARLRAAFSIRCTMRRWLLAVISAWLYTSAAYADEGSARINYFERLDGLRIVDAVPASSAEPRQQTNTTLIFDAFGRRFTLVLERNEQLTSKLPLEMKRRIADVALYRGTVDGLSGSWARLTRQGSTVSGVIWDGADLYAIEPVERVASRLVSPQDFGADTIIIYRSRDTVDDTGKPVVVAPLGFDKGSEQIASLAGARSPFKEVDVGLVADALFVAPRPDAATLMLHKMNIADGFFLQQLGVHLNVTQIIEAPQPDPFTSDDPATLRTALEAFKSSSEDLRNLGLVHLFTGRALTGDTGENLNVIGIANVGSLCDPVRAVSLHQASASGVFTEKVVAHEIAHVFGAPHDGQAGSACSATPTTYLMAPVYNGSEQFSECSIEQMRAKIASVSCVADVPPNDVSVLPNYISDSLLAGRSFSGNVTIESTGPTDAFGLELKIAGNGVELTEAGNFGSCSKSAGAFYCTVSRLRAGVSANAYFSGIGPTPGHGSVDVSVASSSDPNPANNSYRFELDFLPAINFSTSSVAASPVGVHPGEVSEITWDFVNTGPSPATNVELTISSQWFDIVTFAPPGGGTCRPHPTAVRRWVCAIGTVPVNQPQRLLLQARALSSGVPPGQQLTNGLTFTATAAEPQLNLNTFVSAPVVIATTIGDVAVEMTGVPAVAVEGSSVEVTLIGRNAGPDSAHGVVLFLHDVARALTAIKATSTAGTCAVGSFEDLECALGTLASGDSVEITIQGVARTFRDASYSVVAVIRSDDFDPSTANNVVSTDMRVTLREPPAPPPPPPAGGGVDSGGGTSGGGGGTTDPLWLAGLITLLLSRRKRTLHVLRLIAPSALLLICTESALADVVSFPETPVVTLATSSQSVAAGDLDGDLDIDLVVAPNFGRARYYLNDGTSTPFAGAGLPLDETRNANSVTLGDVNGDLRLDIVVGDFNGAEHVYLNNGSVTPFDQVMPTDVGTLTTDSTYNVYLVDFDDDGDLDVITANTNQHGNKIYFNNGTNAPFADVPAVFLSPDRLYSRAMAFGDFEGDGDIDIVVANEGGFPNEPGVQVFFNNGSATPFLGAVGQTLTTVGAGSVAVGDVDGDADVDIVAGTSGTAALVILNNGTTAPFVAAELQNVAEVGTWRSVVELVDMNADTRLDLLVSSFEVTAAASTSQYFVVLNNGSTQPFADRAGIPIGGSRADAQSWSFAIADFDGDTDKDVMIGGLGDPDRLFLATIGPDKVPPQLAIRSPVANSTLRGTVTVSASAIDNDGLDSVSFQVLNLGLGQRLTPPFEVRFDTTLTPNGLQSISAIARDRSGNESLASVIVTIANPVNQAPTVSAGADVTASSLTEVITLTGSVSDDDLPSTGTLTTTWSQVSGPAAAIFADDSALSTELNVPEAGTYVLRLTANDGAVGASDDVTVTVSAAPAPRPTNQPPAVSAGADVTVASPTAAITLTGTVSDDGLPSPGTLTTGWSQVSGPGAATFGNGSALSTAVNVPAAGTYVLRLTATDGATSTSDDVTVTVGATQEPPTTPASSSGGGGALGLVELLIALAVVGRRGALRLGRGRRASASVRQFWG